MPKRQKEEMVRKLGLVTRSAARASRIFSPEACLWRAAVMGSLVGLRRPWEPKMIKDHRGQNEGKRF